MFIRWQRLNISKIWRFGSWDGRYVGKLNIFFNTLLGKRYKLRDQMDSSSGSIMDNIAEGFGRGGNMEFRNFLGYSRGSCTELKSQLYRARDKNLISEERFKNLSEKCEMEIAKLTTFISFLNRSDFKGSKFRKE